MIEVLPHLRTNVETLGTSLTTIGTSIPRELRHLSPFSGFIYSFGDHKRLEIVPHLIMDFGILDISLRKFGTFNPRATTTPISFPMVYLILWGPLGNDCKLFPILESTFEP